MLVHLGKAKKPYWQCLVLNANGLTSNVSPHGFVLLFQHGVQISEEEAKKKIYNVSCERYFGFGCEIDEETSNKLEGIAFSFP